MRSTRVTPHHFDHHDALMTGRGRVHPIERVHDNIDRGIETECGRSCFQVVVDRLRHADTIDACFLQLLCGRHRAVAADDDQRLYIELIQNLLRVGNDLRWYDRPITSTDFGHKMTAVGRPNDRAPACHDSTSVPATEN